MQDAPEEPGLTVAPRCENLIREKQAYAWKEDRNGVKDQPVKRDDHAMDAERYGVMHLAGGEPMRIFYV